MLKFGGSSRLIRVLGYFVLLGRAKNVFKAIRNPTTLSRAFLTFQKVTLSKGLKKRAPTYLAVFEISKRRERTLPTQNLLLLG